MRGVLEYTQYRAGGSGHEFAPGALHHSCAHYDTAAAQAGVKACIVLDRNCDSPITLYNVALRNQRADSRRFVIGCSFALATGEQGMRIIKRLARHGNY